MYFFPHFGPPRICVDPRAAVSSLRGVPGPFSFLDLFLVTGRDKQGVFLSLPVRILFGPPFFSIFSCFLSRAVPLCLHSCVNPQFLLFSTANLVGPVTARFFFNNFLVFSYCWFDLAPPRLGTFPVEGSFLALGGSWLPGPLFLGWSSLSFFVSLHFAFIKGV